MRAPAIDNLTYLTVLDLFHGLDRIVLDRIAGGTMRVALRKGEHAFRCGDRCEGFHAVIYGQLKLGVVAPNGSEKVVSVLRSGQTVGRSTMFSGLRYPVYAMALSDTLLLHVSREAISDELDRTPQLAHRMLAGLGHEVIGLLSEVESFSLRNGMQRLVAFLLGGGDGREVAGPSEVHLDIRKTDLASMLNITPEHLSRCLAELANARLILVKGPHITLLEPDRLRAILRT